MSMSVLPMAILALIAAFWLTRPFWQAQLPAAQRRRAANIAAYRTRLTELETEQAAGLLSAEEAGQLKRELDQRLLGEADAREAGSAESPGKLAPALLLAVLFVVGGAVWYVQAGSWRTAEQIAQGPVATDSGQPPDITAMVAKLEARLQAEPDSLEGWTMLGRSYFVMERYAEAASAYAKANELSGNNNPALLTGEGEALAMARDRDLLGRPQQLFEAALKLAPDDGKTLWYAGLANAQAKDYAQAQARFGQLLQQELPEDIRAAVVQRLDELRQLQGGAPMTAAATPAAAQAAGNQSAVATGLSLSITVELDPALTAQLPPGAVLFVFAKAASGPPMPLAVQRLPGARLPLTVKLDDSMAMTPAMKLSQFDRWTITARLSQSGGAQAQPGDLQGSLQLGREAAGQPQTLVIRERVGG
ncbi:c-type cytochrome biogenesis protein CcmI [Stagnimonas aquatica]|uniref:C-type cytochrome biogenesis protein CcmI n=2 Tax=Stagnimonas aquatica TaxID=2689987 RepID=A0A3N0V9D3_9GAMM|nr:c-type cytochrome biogenesis protein CcmI [Stagnimonas aquatica]